MAFEGVVVRASIRREARSNQGTENRQKRNLVKNNRQLSRRYHSSLSRVFAMKNSLLFVLQIHVPEYK